MSDLHLFTPTPVREVNNILSLSLYVSSEYYAPPYIEYLYYGYDVPLPGTRTFTLDFAPVSPDSIQVVVVYPDSITLTYIASGTAQYDGSTYTLLAPQSPVYTPAPVGYLDEFSGKIIFVGTNASYNNAYKDGPVSLVVDNYVVLGLFTDNIYLNDLVIDFGDNTTTTFQYSGTKGDTFAHTYSSTGTYTIRTTAEFINYFGDGVFVETLTAAFTNSVEIIDTIIPVEDII